MAMHRTDRARSFSVGDKAGKTCISYLLEGVRTGVKMMVRDCVWIGYGKKMDHRSPRLQGNLPRSEFDSGFILHQLEYFDFHNVPPRAAVYQMTSFFVNTRCHHQLLTNCPCQCPLDNG